MSLKSPDVSTGVLAYQDSRRQCRYRKPMKNNKLLRERVTSEPGQGFRLVGVGLSNSFNPGDATIAAWFAPP